MDTVLKLTREEAIKKVAGFCENLSKRMMYKPESLIGSNEDRKKICNEICMNLENIKTLLKASKLQEVSFFCDELDTITLPKKRPKIYFPGGKTYWEEFVYFKC